MKYSEAQIAHRYYCIQCKRLIASANKPLDIPAVCSNCEHTHTTQMLDRQKEKIAVDHEVRKKKAENHRNWLKKKKEKNAQN